MNVSKLSRLDSRLIRLLYDIGLNDREISDCLSANHAAGFSKKINQSQIFAWRERSRLPPNTSYAHASRALLRGGVNSFPDYLDELYPGPRTNYNYVISSWLRENRAKEYELFESIAGSRFIGSALYTDIWTALRKAGGSCMSINKFLKNRLPRHVESYRSSCAEAVKHYGKVRRKQNVAKPASKQSQYIISIH